MLRSDLVFSAMTRTAVVFLVVAVASVGQVSTGSETLTLPPDAAKVSVASSTPTAEAAEAKTGKSYFYFRVAPDLLLKYDPVTDKEVARVRFNHGVGGSTYLSHDRKRLFVTTGKRAIVEEVDLATMTVVDEHDFRENGYIVRLRSIKECPGGKLWYVSMNRIKVNLDTFDILDPEYVLYNREESEVVKRLRELPREIRSGARISPCGTKWHVFGSDIKILDAETLKEEGKIDLSTPRFTGMGPLSVRGGTDLFRGKNPDAYRLIYSMRDPVKTGRTTYGLVDISIKDKKVTKITEWGWAPSSFRWLLSADGSVGVASASGFRSRGGGNLAGDPTVNLVRWDMIKGKKLAERRTIVRNGLRLGAFSPDGKKAYLQGRGHEFWVFDENLKHIKTVENAGEIMGSVYVVDE